MVFAFKIDRNDKIPARYVLWVMMFTCCWVAYMLRVNMSLNLVAMVPKSQGNATLRSLSDSTDDETRNETLRQGDITAVREVSRTFDWSTDQQALILGSYFWSYPITSILGGMAAERWGPRYVVLITTLLSGVLTSLSPAAANWSYIALVVIRFILGLAGGFTYPALHALIARWAPPAEKGKFISSLMGGTLGTVVTWSVTGPMMQKYGWESAFYLPAALTFIWCGLWWYLIADTPAVHPRISDTEKKYILDALGDKIQISKSLPPFKKIMTSIPFLAMIVLHYGNLWGLYFVMTAAPKFMSSVLGFNLSSAGAVAALPYLARLLFATIFGAIGDYILARNLMTTTAIRKSFCLFSHILPGVLLVVLVYGGTSAAVPVALITLSMGLNGAATLTNLQNHQDLAPNFAGTLYGIANCIGSSAGFFTPMITAYFTRDGDTFAAWRPVFYIGASVYIIAAVIFIVFGSGNTQPWNYGTDAEGKTTGDLKEMNANTKNNDARKKEAPLTVA